MPGVCIKMVRRVILSTNRFCWYLTLQTKLYKAPLPDQTAAPGYWQPRQPSPHSVYEITKTRRSDCNLLDISLVLTANTVR